MNIKFKHLALGVSLLFPVAFCAADTTVVFDTVTGYTPTMNGIGIGSIRGVEKDTGADITATFGRANRSTAEARSVQAFCPALILTAMEKPGRYYLSILYRLDDFGLEAIVNCSLDLKLAPE